MSRILIFPLKIDQITLFMIENIIPWLGGDDLALNLDISVPVHTPILTPNHHHPTKTQ